MNNIREFLLKGKLKIISNPDYIFISTGMHFWRGLTNKTSNFVDGDARLRGSVGATQTNGTFKGQVEIYSEELAKMHANDKTILPANKGWKKKVKQSTFFPAGWREKQLLEEVAFAVQNKRFSHVSPPNDLYLGTTKSGIIVEILISPAGKIESIYPQ